MPERGAGRTLLTCRAAALTGGIIGPHHAASKAGQHGLTHFPASRPAANRGHGQRAGPGAGPPRPGCCPATRPSCAAGARRPARPAIPGHQPRRGHPRQGLPRPARSSRSMAASTPTGTGRHSPRRADVLAGLPPTSALALAAVPALRDRHVLRERSCAARQRLFSERLRSGHR